MLMTTTCPRYPGFSRPSLHAHSFVYFLTEFVRKRGVSVQDMREVSADRYSPAYRFSEMSCKTLQHANIHFLEMICGPYISLISHTLAFVIFDKRYTCVTTGNEYLNTDCNYAWIFNKEYLQLRSN